MSLSFRICTQDDIKSVNTFFVTAYNFGENQEDMLNFFWSLQPDGWWIGFKDGIPCAFGGAVDYKTFNSVGMLAIDPKRQNQGIGTVLMSHIIDWCTQRSGPTIMLEANVKAVSLYKRLGFIEEEKTLKFRLIEPVKSLDILSTIEVVQKKDIPDIAKFDTISFGGQRENLLSLYLDNALGRVFLSRSKSGKITGYIYAQSRALGPWVAETIEDAEQLLKRALMLSFASGPSITIPSVNKAGVALLKRYGFVENFPSAQHMRLGNPVQSQRSLIFGQASLALG